MVGGGHVDGDVALVAQGDEQVVVCGVDSTPEPELGGEAGLRGVEEGQRARGQLGARGAWTGEPGGWGGSSAGHRR